MNKPVRKTIPRIIFITLVLLSCIPACIGNVHEAVIFYFDGEIATDQVLDLEQGYRFRIENIRNGDAEISIFDGSEEIANSTISSKSPFVYEKEIDDIGYDIMKILMGESGNGSDVAAMTIEQYIDPDRAFDHLLLSGVSMSIMEGGREPLKEGYELGATSIIDNTVILTLYKNDEIVKQERLNVSDPEMKRFVCMEVIDGQYHTILIAKPDRISDVDGESVHLTELSQFKEPESSDQNNRWNIKLAESMIFRYLLSICIFAGIFALIRSITGQMRR